ncbi:triose-phosphate isomerase [Patescibacteria group bacterium]|nr:triose-phosphate isomerase [Patescibacteria group bacterium]
MNKPIIIANWKSNKTVGEAREWWKIFSNTLSKSSSKEKLVIICPSFTLLPLLKEEIKNSELEILLGAQDVSAFEQGSNTGEVNARQIKEFADYVIIGHSERRGSLKEDNEILAEKVKRAKEAKLSTIFCIQGENTLIPEGVNLIAYEPIFAIGTGNPETPENAETVANTVKKDARFLYGGSVKSDNIQAFSKKRNIDGVLVGGASLNPLEFAKIVELA